MRRTLLYDYQITHMIAKLLNVPSHDLDLRAVRDDRIELCLDYAAHDALQEANKPRCNCEQCSRHNAAINWLT